MHRVTNHLALMSLALSLTACGKATSEDVRQRTAPIVSRVVVAVQGALTTAGEMSEVKQLFESLEIKVPTDDAVFAEADGSDGFDDQELAAEINDFLARFIFTEDNVESSSGDSVTFLLRGAVVCSAVTETECAAPWGGPTECTSGQASQGCIETVDKLQIRIVATLVGSDGVDLELRIGSGPTVITLRLRPDSVTAELSLTGAAQAAQRIAELTGESIELPQTMEGTLSVGLILDGPKDLRLRSSVTQAVKVEMKAQGDLLYRVQVEQRDPLAELRLRSAPPAIELTVDWGAVEVLLPARDVWEAASGSLSLVLKGLTGKLATDGKGGIALTGLGLGAGASTLSWDGKLLAQVDLNADSGRKFDLQLAPWQGDLPACTFTPGLDLAVKLQLAPIEPFLDEPLEPWARDESYRLLLAGNGGAQVTPLRETPGFGGGVKVLQGQLTLQSLVQPASVVVPTGSCLVWHDEPAPGGHPLLGHFTSQACP
jgi:hypothetical protein